MGYGDYCWGLYRDYSRDPFPHSLLSTRQPSRNCSELRMERLPGSRATRTYGPTDRRSPFGGLATVVQDLAPRPVLLFVVLLSTRPDDHT